MLRPDHPAREVALKKPVLLGICLVGFALILLLPAAPGAVGGWSAYRWLVLWGSPAAAGILAVLLFIRPPSERPGGASWRAILTLLPFCAVAFAVEYGVVGIGHAAGWITFSFGDQWLADRLPTSWIWGLPVCLLLGVLGWERAIRRTLLVAWSGSIPRRTAAILAGSVGLCLAAPSVLRGSAGGEIPFTLASLVVLACREAACTLIFLSGGGIVLAGAYRGVLLYFDTLVLNDWASLAFPAANYVTSDSRFYLARALTSTLAVGVLVLGARVAAARRNRRDPAGVALHGRRQEFSAPGSRADRR